MKKPLELKIFLFCELVVACRILLFEIPMLVDKYFGSQDIALTVEDRFQAVVIFVSIFYLVAAIAALLGNSFWRLLHYLVTALAVLLTLAFAYILRRIDQPFLGYYYFPLFCSVLTSWVVVSYRKMTLEKDNDMKTILIVDDDVSIHKMLEPNLTSNGFKVVSAKTGEEGLSKAKETKPDIIILDVILPGMKGRAVCASLKKDPVTKDIPVLFLTSKDSPDDVQAELEAGGIGHLTKPINPQYLVAQIKRLVG